MFIAFIKWRLNWQKLAIFMAFCSHFVHCAAAVISDLVLDLVSVLGTDYLLNDVGVFNISKDK